MQPQPDTLSATFAALADPTRRAILARLAAGDASVKDLSAPFAMTQPAVSKHLRVLERAGLVERGQQAQWRPRRLQAGPLKEVAEWVGQYRPHWDQSFERLDAYLRAEQQRQAPRRAKKGRRT
ncbi:MAG TPA: metalloregulator ArsR/SmtB family transcription factor [Candidatus Limnocylindria bacterium]